MKLKREQLARILPMLVLMLAAAIVLLLFLVILLIVRDTPDEPATPVSQASPPTISALTQAWLDLTATRTPSEFDATYDAARATALATMSATIPPSQPTSTLSITQRPASTPSFTPRPTFPPTQISVPTVGSVARISITEETAEQVQQLAWFGRDTINDITWSPDSSFLVAARGSNVQIFRRNPVDGTFNPDPSLFRSDEMIWAVALSPDGTLLAAATADTTLRLWDVASKNRLPVQTISYSGAIYDVAFSPNGNMVAAAGEDNLVHLWDITTGQRRTTLSGHTSRVVTVAFSSDGTRLASGSHDFSVRIWDTATGTTLNILPITRATMRTLPVSLAFSPIGKLAVGDLNGGVTTWNIELGSKDLIDFHQDGTTVVGLAWSMDGSVLATGSDNKQIKLWRTRVGWVLIRLTAHTDAIKSLAMSPDGTLLASCTLDDGVRIWGIPVEN